MSDLAQRLRHFAATSDNLGDTRDAQFFREVAAEIENCHDTIRLQQESLTWQKGEIARLDEVSRLRNELLDSARQDIARLSADAERWRLSADAERWMAGKSLNSLTASPRPRPSATIPSSPITTAAFVPSSFSVTITYR